MAYHNGPKTVTTGLILSLDAGNIKSYPGSGTTWNDLSGNGNTGTLINSPTFSSGSGGSIVFNGTNNYVNTGLDLSWNNINSVTISFYIKPQSLSSHFPFLGKGPTNWEWQLIQRTTSLQFVYWNTGGGHTNGPIPELTNFFTNINDFIHVTMVWNHVDNKYYFYRNSILVNTTTWVDASINQNRTDPVYIGGNIYQWDAAGTYWPGNISNMIVYNRALSNRDIEQNFNATRGRFGI